MPITIKSLIWKDGEARTGFGSAYAVHQQADGQFVAVGCGSFVGGTHPTREAAQNAAQSDFEARILSALDRTTFPTAEGWQTHDLITGRAYESINFGTVKYLGLDNYCGETTHKFATPHHGPRYVKSESINQFLNPRRAALSSNGAR